MDTRSALNLLRREVVKAGSQKQLAAQLGVSPGFLSDVLNGRRGLTDRILQQIGLSREVVIVKDKV